MKHAIFALILCAPAFCAAKAPVTHETVWLMKRVGGPVPSPDGKWAVFTVVEPAYDEKDQFSDLWIVPADGSSKARRLTFSRATESGVAWSPDSRKIAFTSKREGDDASQVYVLDIAAGGESMRITSLSTGASSPKWRPDGKTLLFASAVYPGAADDEANKKIAAEQRAHKYSARAFDTFPIRAWDHWLDERQTHILVQEAIPGARARDLLAGTRLAAEPGYATPSSGTGGDEPGAIWTPDGNSIVFAATTRRHTAAYASVKNDLYLVPAAGGEPRAITSGEDSYSKPAFRPDGKALYAIENRRGETYSLERVARWSWPNPAERTLITARFDHPVSGLAFSPSGSTLYLLAEDKGRDKVYSMPADGGEVRMLYDQTHGTYTGLASAEKAERVVLLGTFESAVEPAEIASIDPGGKGHRLLSEFNVEKAAGLDWEPVREFWFQSKRGKRIHSFVVLPPDFDEHRKYPLFVVLHGGPHSAWKDQFVLRWNYHLLASPGYVVLLTNYTGSTGFGERFAQEILGDPLKGPGDEINEAADEAISRFPFIDGSRQVAGGASYGGHLANWLQASTTRYKCLISHAGLVNLESQWGTSDTIYGREITNGGPVWEQGNVWREQNPIRYAANFRTPILLTVGERDFRVPMNNTIENWSVLQRLRIPSRLIVFPEANHWILRGEDSRFFYREVHGWIKKWLESP